MPHEPYAEGEIRTGKESSERMSGLFYFVRLCGF